MNYLKKITMNQSPGETDEDRIAKFLNEVNYDNLVEVLFPYHTHAELVYDGQIGSPDQIVYKEAHVMALLIKVARMAQIRGLEQAKEVFADMMINKSNSNKK